MGNRKEEILLIRKRNRKSKKVKNKGIIKFVRNLSKRKRLSRNYWRSCKRYKRWIEKMVRRKKNKMGIKAKLRDIFVRVKRFGFWRKRRCVWAFLGVLTRNFLHYLECDKFSISASSSDFLYCDVYPYKDYFVDWTELARK